MDELSEAMAIATKKRSSRRRIAPSTSEGQEPAVSPVAAVPPVEATSTGYETQTAPPPEPMVSPDPVVSSGEVPPPVELPKVATPATEERLARKVIQGSTLAYHDVVQITDRTSRLYGGFFIVGDVHRGKVHGYYLTEGQHKQFVTIGEEGVQLVGVAHIRSSVPCSAQWTSNKGSA